MITARGKGFGEKEKAEVLSLYGPVGCKPEGEALLGHWPHSVIYTRTTRRGEVEMTSLKERGRRGKGLDATVMRSFPYQYLKDVAGWQSEETDKVDEQLAVTTDQFTTAG